MEERVEQQRDEDAAQQEEIAALKRNLTAATGWLRKKEALKAEDGAGGDARKGRGVR